jgi:hypothetical protein
MPRTPIPHSKANYGLAWLLLCFAFLLHFWDEAAHHFLTHYNATAIARAARHPHMPRMDMSFKTFLLIMIAANAASLGLTPLAYRHIHWFRPFAYAVANIQTLNGLNHSAMTIQGHSVESVLFHGPAPGVYTSPVLLLASGYLFWSLYISSPRRALCLREPASPTVESLA